MTESDKKAVEEFRREYKKSGYCCVECSLKWVELFIRKTRQEAREEVMNLPCMQDESTRKILGKDTARVVWIEAQNDLRHEIRDALNKKEIVCTST